MTLAAPRSRQGKFILVLAMFAALVAVGGALLWANDAQASALPNTTLELDQNPDGPATIAPGTVVTYTATATTTAGIAAGDTLTVEIDIPANLSNVTFTGAGCSPAASDADSAGGDATCNWDNAAPGSYTLTLTGIASGDLPVPGAVVCSVVAIAEDDCDAFATGNEVEPAEDVNPTDTGLLTVAAPVTVVDATNFPGAPHTFVFALAAGVTCQSDVSDTGNVECLPADVTVGGTVICTAGPPVVGDADLADSSTVSVTITPTTGDEGTCTVILDTKYVGPCEDCSGDDFDIEPVTATKTFSTAEAAGELRHLDDPDAATEDAAGTDDSDHLEDWCDGVNTPDDTCGILLGQDDLDDATGSFHQACIINGSLTHAGNSTQITWDIVPQSGSPLPNPVSVTELAGPLGEPCVRWSTGFTGTQSITAVYDNGVGPAVTFYWDGYCVEAGDCTAVDDDDDATGTEPDEDPVPLPLVKEWNDIDETRIVAASGIVGDTLFDNSGDLGDWADRDCSLIPVDPGFCADANLDGLTLQQEATFTSPGTLILAPERSFIDYTFGSHSDAGGIYDGPVDGAEQTYTISGDCGSVRLEDPQNGEVIVLSNANGSTPATVLSSDKGVGFTFLPTDDGEEATLANADCGPNAVICIDIETREDNLFRSPPIDEAEDEEICIEYTIGPPTAKTPILAWAGQRVILEHYWGSADGECVELDNLQNGQPGGAGESDEFGVLYSKQAGPGSFTAALQSNGFNDVDQTGENVIVDVDLVPTDDDQDGVTDANSMCISRVIYESEDQGEVDVSAYVVDDDDDLNEADPRSQQVAFVIYFMKFEDLTLGLVPGARSGHNEGTFSPTNPIDPASDATSITDANVSADVLARARVRGWVLTDNCPARDSAVGQNGEFIPANRCIFPDDWLFKAGGDLALETRPNFDIMNTPPTAPSQTACSQQPRAAGPFSLLDTNVQGDTSADVCGDSLAPNVAGEPCLAGFNYGASGFGCRETVFPDGAINKYDAPMPPALVRFLLVGAGFLKGADKDDIYPSNSNPFYVTHIPAEPYIAPINSDLSGYQWNSWGGAGGKSGQYDFWDDLADHGPEVVSCPGLTGASGCVNSNVDCPPNNLVPVPDGEGCLTGGYKLTKVYTDNHGEAMTWVNGDADLTFAACDQSAGATDDDHHIVLLNGYYCEEGDTVGSSTVSASVDYPDKRKHFAIASNDVTITWLWGGNKEVTIVPTTEAQFNYVVLHLTDRDGFCDPTPSQHPVIGERVTFLIDSPNGVIFPDANGIPAALLGTWTSKTADVTTFDTNGADSALTITPVQVDGECQAWIHISESLLGPVNVIVTAFDPEGTVTFDVIINEPTPAPTTPPPVTPSPTPANQPNLWADIDCDDVVNPVDSLKVLRHDAGLSITQEAPCPDAGESVLVVWDADSENEDWGDADCSGGVDPIDSLKILRYDAGLFYIQQEPCPDIGEEVLISAQ
ncbi:MAG: hypothetical protein WD904_05185 [Dehalococcoidia bacterium]